MVKRLISFDEEAEGTGLPAPVVEGLGGAFATKADLENLPRNDIVISDDPDTPLTEGQILFIVEPATPPAWSPLDLPLAWWFDASQISDVADGAEVTQWQDLSGHGRHATQGAAPSAPTLTSAGIGNLPSVEFDGTSCLTSAEFPPITDPITIFMVARADAATSASFTDGITNAPGRAYVGIVSDKWYISRSAVLSGTDADTDPHVHTTRFWDLDFHHRVDGSIVAERADAYIAGRAPIGVTLGARWDGANGLDGHIAEAFMVLGELTDEQINAAEAYLSEKWGLA